VNTLYYGDNLIVLRNDIPAESVDLIYLDLPSKTTAKRQFFTDESRWP